MDTISIDFVILSVQNKVKGAGEMKGFLTFMVILTGLFATFMLYNKQMGSVPLLLLSAFFFYLGIKEVVKIKNNK